MKPGKKADRAERIKSVEREYFVADKARETLENVLKVRSESLTSIKLNAADLKAFKANLRDTYFIRLFAEFETAIKDYWKNGISEEPRTRIMDVIDSLASRRSILDAVKINVHTARKWRNRLVHEADSDALEVELTDARRAFGKFLGFLPDDW